MRATPKHNEECKRLLTLMGIPYVEVGTCTVTIPFMENVMVWALLEMPALCLAQSRHSWLISAGTLWGRGPVCSHDEGREGVCYSHRRHGLPHIWLQCPLKTSHRLRGQVTIRSHCYHWELTEPAKWVRERVTMHMHSVYCRRWNSNMATVSLIMTHTGR